MRDVTAWVDEIHERTVQQDESVLAQSPGVRREYSALRAGAQALLTGDPARLFAYSRDKAPLANWGSWMEGVPVAQALLFNDDIIIDLVPARTEAEFVGAYHCLPRQFLDILFNLEANRRRVFFNLRSYDPHKPETAKLYEQSWDQLGGIFTFLKTRDFRDCYVNAARAYALGRLFDPNDRQAEFEQRLSPPAFRSEADPGFARSFFGQLHALFATDKGRSALADHPEVLVRGPGGKAQIPAPIQIFKRIAYHLTFSEITPDIPRDPLLGSLVARAERGDQFSADELIRAAAQATALHHKYTAPLTGAYGGMYNLADTEAAAGYVPIGHESRTRAGAFTEFLYGYLSNAIRQKDGRLEAIRTVSGGISLSQDGEIPQDDELRDFLDMLPESADFLRKQRQLEEALRTAVARDKADFSDVDALIKAATDAHRRVNGAWTKLRRKLFIGAGGAVGGPLAVGIGAEISSLGFVSEALKTIAKATGDKLIEDWLDRGTDSKQIVTIMDRLRR